MNYFSEKPKTLVDGGYIKGKYIVFYNYNVKYIGDDVDMLENLEPGTQWTAEVVRLTLPELTLQELLNAIPDQAIGMMTDDEAVALLKWLNLYNDIQAWYDLCSARISQYDKSETINHFTIDGKYAWLDKSTRVGLVNMYSLYADDEEVPELWIDNVAYSVTKSSALSFLKELEVYASKCFSITQQHHVINTAIRDNSTVEEYRDFDITAGFPEPIAFSL